MENERKKGRREIQLRKFKLVDDVANAKTMREGACTSREVSKIYRETQRG